MDYGINHKKKPSVEDSIRCLEYAMANGIRAIDMATAYGTAEEITGLFLKQCTVQRDQLFISTKLLPNIMDNVAEEEYAKAIREQLTHSLKTLNLDYVDAYMFHSSRYAYSPALLEAMTSVKKEGLARKVGVSIYNPDERFACINNPNVEFIQAPYSVFDHRMKTSGFLDEANGKLEVDVRSVFLQGLVLQDKDSIPEFLLGAKPVLEKLNAICEAEGISPVHERILNCSIVMFQRIS